MINMEIKNLGKKGGFMFNHALICIVIHITLGVCIKICMQNLALVADCSKCRHFNFLRDFYFYTVYYWIWNKILIRAWKVNKVISKPYRKLSLENMLKNNLFPVNSVVKTTCSHSLIHSLSGGPPYSPLVQYLTSLFIFLFVQ